MLPKGKVDAAAGSYKVYRTLKYNDTLTLRDIPERAFAYRLGNRSALDWIVDQYRVKTDKRSGITHDPNGYSDDPQYILKLIERVITVSLRTVDIVEGSRANWNFERNEMRISKVQVEELCQLSMMKTPEDIELEPGIQLHYRQE